MNPIAYKAFRVIENENGSFQSQVVERKTNELSQNGVLIKVLWSALNYKDALSASGHKGITKTYPHTPGIDACGVVVESLSPIWHIGQKVLVTGYDLGMNTDGGFGQYINVPAEWIVALPKNITEEESMIIGTAGFTAALALHQILRFHSEPPQHTLLVSGASGGVGSIAINLAAKEGFKIVASTGKAENYNYLLSLGASEVIPRDEINDLSSKFLLRPKWDCAIDTVGGNTLATILKSLKPHGSVAVCGNVKSSELYTSVYPFLLNGINMLGVNSATTPMLLRHKLWQLLSTDWKPDFEKIQTVVSTLDDLHTYIALIRSGNVSGRVLLKHEF